MSTRKPIELQKFPKQLSSRVDFGVLPASLKYTIDGDTAGCLIDRGAGQYRFETIRLAGIDADALNDPDPAIAQKAREARDELARLLPEGTKVLVTGTGMDAYDRTVATIEIVGGDGVVVNVNDHMVATGHAKPWS